MKNSPLVARHIYIYTNHAVSMEMESIVGHDDLNINRSKIKKHNASIC